MKTKNILIIFAGILLIGIVAAGTITNVFPIDVGNLNFIAGEGTQTSFNFDYPDVEGNYNNAPLVIRVNLTSMNQNFPVWKDDFDLSIVADQYLLPGFWHYNTIPMTCKEDAPIIFKAKDSPEIQYTINEIPNGTFYCYNPNYYILQLDSRDVVNISISSRQNLYPGNYSLAIELLEMEPDTNSPEIQIILENFVYNETQEIPIKLNVTDLYSIRNVEYKITNPDLNDYYNSGWIEAQLNESSGFYEHLFNFEEHNLNQSDSYWVFARACDVLNNCGEM